MNEGQFERLIQSFESIAESLGKICVIQNRICERDYPERKEPREAVVSRIKTDEDIAKENQGAGVGPIGDWLGGFEDAEYVGVREKAFLEEERQRNASATVQSEQRPDTAVAEAAGRKARATRKHPSAKQND